MKNPAVSIGLPVYNGDNYLKNALDSMLSQTFRDFELIISDNASTDGTIGICKSYADSDSRIRFFRNERNLGAAWNFNQVFRLAKGIYFQWACHDDVWSPSLLERCVEVLDRNPGVVLCYPNTTYIDMEGQPIRRVLSRPDYHDKNPNARFRSFLQYHRDPNECCQVLGLFRAEVLGRSLLIGSYPASDMVLLGEIALYGEFHEIPEQLFFRRDHPLTSVRANPDWEDRAVWFNPSCRGKIQMPRWRWFSEWLKSILRAPLGMSERMKCISELTSWAKKSRSEFVLEMKQGARTWARRTNQRGSERIRVLGERILK